jgi:hypothetical protein
MLETNDEEIELDLMLCPGPNTTCVDVRADCMLRTLF